MAPHAIFDLLVGYDLGKLLPVDARLTLSVLNVLNTPFLYRVESALGGTHYGYARMVNVTFSARY